MNQPLLKVQDVSYTYHTKAGETPALSHISFSVFPGEFVAIVGPSGCGKSTFLDMLCGLLKPSGGELLLNEKPLAESATNIGYMLQKDHLFEWRTIYSNMLLGLEIQKRITPKSKERWITFWKIMVWISSKAPDPPSYPVECAKGPRLSVPWH